MRDSATPFVSLVDELTNPDDFRPAILSRWNAGEEIVAKLGEMVEDKRIHPLIAGAIVSCALGRLFEYETFHYGNETLADALDLPRGKVRGGVG